MYTGYFDKGKKKGQGIEIFGGRVDEGLWDAHITWHECAKRMVINDFSSIE